MGPFAPLELAIKWPYSYDISRLIDRSDRATAADQRERTATNLLVSGGACQCAEILEDGGT